MRRVYLDHAATTPVHPEVVEVMRHYMLQDWGNPSSIHSFGREARAGVDEARAKVAALIGGDPEEIVFTGGGTEADNMAIKGTAWELRNRGDHIITSAVEHHAVLHTVEWLEKQGFRATYLPVDEYGMVDPGDVERAITSSTILVSIMAANNEVGTVQPVAQIARICREKGVRFHTDAVQAVGQLPIDVHALGVDLLSLSAHKIYGPKGVGALYVRRGVRLTPLLHGGAHERKRRAGTEGVPGIVGLGKAAELARLQFDQRVEHYRRVRDLLWERIRERVPEVRLNGHPTERLPNNLNLSVLYVEGESMLLNLDMKGIAASSGSACTSGSLEPSHVLLAMGIPHEVAHGSLRMTVGVSTTEEDTAYVAESLGEIVDRLRAMSPLWNARVR
ncbi:MAG: cysteine desulfurase NifS [Bacillota bacterium]|nr:cysteine desulfurase NifS [Bacillota bacterium]MDI7250565.1 cysteine desulfurase NifS [Bacillota bacterium]